MKETLAQYVSMLRRDFTEYCNRRLQEMGLSLGRFYFILYVGKHPGCGPKEMSEALHMDIGHTARSLTKLEQGGFLTQEPNPQDRRAHILYLTEKGEEVFDIGHELFAQWDDTVMRQMRPEDREALMGLLRGLVQQRRWGNKG